MSTNKFFYTIIFLSLSLLAACGGGGSDTLETNYRVDTSTGSGGSISPSAVTVSAGETANFTITPDSGFTIASASGCSGNLSGNTYTTAAINNNCTVTVNFIDSNISQWTVMATAGAGGTITPVNTLVADGSTTQLTVTPDNNFFIDSVTGCNGVLSGNTYTTAAITANCTITASFSLLQVPVVDAGADQTVDELVTVSLSGSATDSDGPIVSYLWTQISGTSVTISDSDTVNASFAAPDVVNTETLTFQLQVTDNDGQVGIDNVLVTVNPVAVNQVSVVAATGMDAVGFPAGYIYWTVFDPVIGDAGHIAFLGAADTSIGQTSQNRRALWSGMPNDLQLLIKENDPLPGLPSNVLYSGSTSTNSGATPSVIVNSSGAVAHFSSLKGSVNNLNDNVLLVHKDNALAVVMRMGDSAVGLPNGNTYGALGQYAFSQAGLVFIAEVKNANNIVGYGVWLWDFNETRLLALSDLSRNSVLYDLPQESPNIDGGNCIFSSLVSRAIQINDRGDIIFNTVLVSKDGASCAYTMPLLKWNNNNFTAIVAHGQAVDGLNDYTFNRLLSAFETPILHANGDIGLHSTIWSGSRDQRSFFWVSKENGDQQYLAVGGELLPGSSSQTMINNLGLLGVSPRADGKGNYLLSTLNNANREEIHLLKGVPSVLPYSNINELGASGLSTLVKVGDVPPEYPSTAYYSLIYRQANLVPSINGNGNIAFVAYRADALDAQIQVAGLWYIDSSGTIKKLIESGDTIPVDGANIGVTSGFVLLDLERSGGPAQHSDTNAIFVSSRLSNAFQALLLINP